MNMANDNYRNYKTLILVEYLQFVFQEIKGYMDKPWTREEVLNDTIIDGKTLRCILTKNSALKSSDKNTFVFRGGQYGDGKVFYFYKLVQTCYNSIPHFTIEHLNNLHDKKWSFRIPILVDDASLESYLDMQRRSKNTAVSSAALAKICFEKRIDFDNDDKKQISNLHFEWAAHELANQLFNTGRLAFFLGPDISYELPEFIDELYKNQSTGDFAPVFIAVSNKSFASDIEEGDSFYCKDIPALTAQQVIRYIATEVPGCLNLLEKIRSDTYIMETLSKQERLLKQVDTWKEQIKKKASLDITRFSIEKDAIDRIVSDDDELRKLLYSAAKDAASGNPISDEALKITGNERIFEGDKTFIYTESIFYLLAEEVYNELNATGVTEAKIKSTLQKIISTWDAKVLNYFACFLVKNTSFGIKNYLDILIEIFQNKTDHNDLSLAKVLVDTMVYTNTLLPEDKEDKDKKKKKKKSYQVKYEKDKRDEKEGYQYYVYWVMKHLEEITYEENIFDGFPELKKHNDIFTLLHNDLQDEYDKTKQDCKLDDTSRQRKLRRIVHLYSQIGISMPWSIISELRNPSADVHLRYHIASTLVDLLNAGVQKNLNNLLDFSDIPNLEDDAVLKCELTTLSLLANQRQECDDNYCINDLLNILEDSQRESWRKAHAAGALSKHRGITREEIKSIIDQFRDIIKKELDKLESSDECNYDYLKTVSYIIAAMCTILSSHASEDDDLHIEARAAIEFLLSEYLPHLVENNSSNEQCLDTCLRLLTCGMIHLVLGQSYPLRKKMSQQFSQGSSFSGLLDGIGEANAYNLLLKNKELRWEYTLPDLMDKWQEWHIRTI